MDAIACIKALFDKWESTATNPHQLPTLVSTKEPPPHSDLHPTEVPTPAIYPRVVAPTPSTDTRVITTDSPTVPPDSAPSVPPSAAPRVTPPTAPLTIPNAAPRMPPLAALTPPTHPPAQLPDTIAWPTCSWHSHPDPAPIASRTCYQTQHTNIVTPSATVSRQHPSDLFDHWTMPVLYLNTVQMLDYCQLRLHPKSKCTWNQSYCNELGRLCQGVNTYPSGKCPCVKGTNTFFIINYEEPLPNRSKEVTYIKFVWKLKPHKDDPNHMCITINGDLICYPGNVGTPTGSLELAKIVFNSTISYPNVRFTSFDISNF